MSKLLPLLIGQIKALSSQSNITVVCIDGPTAAGKTILADSLGEEIKNQLDINVEYFRLDWTLLPRDERQKDLVHLMNSEYDFALEGELHMNLDLFLDFLKKIHAFKKRPISDEVSKKFLIQGLYSRENNGKCTGSYEYDFTKKTVLICEGHYTSRTDFFSYIDLNICLLCDKNELLKRKLERVKSYRSSKDATDYFWKIDVPSFSYHIRRFNNSIDLFIDNTDYKNPRLSSINKFKNWLNTSNISNPNGIRFSNEKEIDFDLIFNNIFSASKLNEIIEVEKFKTILFFYKEIDKLIANRLQESIKEDQLGIIESINIEMQKTINKINSNETFLIEINAQSSSSLYDVYHRKIPVSYGIAISSRNHTFYIDYNIYMYQCSLNIFWAGGAYILNIGRDLTSIKEEKENREITFNKVIIPVYFDKNKENNIVELFTPTNFCVAEFLKVFNYKIIFTGREHETTSLNEILNKMIFKNNSVISHRLSNYSEINFYLKFLNSIGVQAIAVGNYLIGINSNYDLLKDNFRSWSKNWINLSKNSKKDQNRYDLAVKKELDDARELVKSLAQDFFVVDSFLFINEENKNMKDRINALKKMLNSPNRSLRKRAFQFILKDEPSLQISIKDLLEIYKIDSKFSKKEYLPLFELPSFYPTIMAEIYLWLHLRGDKSAILAANIYDIDSANSLDVDGILEASTDQNVPIVLQSSFNAIGQKERADDANIFGYLKLEKGPDQLVESCIASTLKLIFKKNKSRPFYGIGLDHVDFKNDKPYGRANRFLKSAVRNANVTHVVLDGSALFRAEKRNIFDLTEAYKQVAKYAVSLIKENESIFLTDLEYCVGEMNYIGNSNLAMIPTREEIDLFVNLLQALISDNDIGQFNCRPSLFIGNVGTVHHDKDLNNQINSEITFSWVEAVKSKNFISAVLHGTTNSEKRVLINSTGGCHKVNVAGDFLKIYQNSLPDFIPNKYKKFSPSSKYLMPEIRKLKAKFDKRECKLITKNIRKRSLELFDNLNSPNLTERDKEYFHRCSYKFPEKLINLILSSYENSKFNNVKIIPKSLKKKLYFSASMIEVSFEDEFCEKADALIAAGINFFHIDVGDGILISRKFSGLSKLGYLSSLNKNLKLHTHLMVKDPLTMKGNNSYIDEYIDAGSTSIAIHRRSFQSDLELKTAMDYIKSRDCRPGLLIEIVENNLTELWNLIKYLEIDWVVIMGVPIGYGGQFFQSSCLRKINFLRSMSIRETNNSMDIEIDGGLNFSNLKQCADAGANIFAGWSIIKDKSVDLILQNYLKVLDQLKK